MNPLFLTLPLVALQAPEVPLKEVDAKELAPASRGPMPPPLRDAVADHNLMVEARRASRRGPSIPALQLPPGSVRVKDKIPDISGWRAYAMEVPGRGTVKVHVVEGRKAWFRVLGVNQWGQEEAGLLQNRIHSGEPQATYQNPSAEARTIYFIVDTLDANMTGEAYTLEVTRGGAPRE